jgi:uncharacterized protein
VGVLCVLGVIGYASVMAVVGLLDDGDSGDTTTATPSEAEAETEAGTDTAADAGADADAGNGDAADEPATEATDVAGVEVEGVALTPGQEATGDSAATTDPEPASSGPPSPSNPAKVFIVGDSDAGTFGPYLQQLLDGTRIVETSLDYKVSSGLARPDFFNWPEELDRKLPEVDPDIVVVTFGGNDSQGLSLPQPELEFIVGDPVANEAEWTEEYQRRAGAVMDQLLENDREVIWVGIPNDDNADVTARLAIQDRAVRAAAAERPEIVFIDTWKRFSGRDGNWAEFVVDPRDGVGKDVRASDGFHLNTTGAEILAIDIAVAVQDALRDMGAAI